MLPLFDLRREFRPMLRLATPLVLAELALDVHGNCGQHHGRTAWARRRLARAAWAP